MIWTTAYKHPRRGRLIWVAVDAAAEREAAREADAEFARLRPRHHRSGYVRYAGPLPLRPGQSVGGVLVPEVYRAQVRAALRALDTH
jgi:hypothetical protein